MLSKVGHPESNLMTYFCQQFLCGIYLSETTRSKHIHNSMLHTCSMLVFFLSSKFTLSFFKVGQKTSISHVRHNQGNTRTSVQAHPNQRQDMGMVERLHLAYLTYHAQKIRKSEETCGVSQILCAERGTT